MVDSDSYRRGHEDALELCLSELDSAKDIEEGKNRVTMLLSLVKEDKVDRLKQMLLQIRR